MGTLTITAPTANQQITEMPVTIEFDWVAAYAGAYESVHEISITIQNISGGSGWANYSQNVALMGASGHHVLDTVNMPAGTTGTWRISVHVQGTSDAMSDDVAVTYGAGGAGPWTSIDAPVAGAIVGGSFTLRLSYGNVTPGSYMVHVELGGLVALHSLYSIDGTSGQLVILLTTPAGLSEGDQTLSVSLVNEAVTVSASEVVTHSTLGGGTNPAAPVVEITAPAAGAAVHGIVAIEATVTGQNAISQVQMFVDGQLRGTDNANLFAGHYGFTWDASRWVNGAHQVLVIATDSEGLTGSAAVTVNTVNALADVVRYRWTAQLGTDENGVPINAASAGFAGVFEVACEVLEPQVLPTDLNLLANLQVGYIIDSASLNWADYTVVDRVGWDHPVMPQGRTIRWMMRATPRQVVSYWDLPAVGLERLALAEDGNVLVLARDTDKVYKFNVATGAVSAWRDLTGWATNDPVDLVAVDGKVLVAAGEDLIVLDVDNADRTMAVKLGADVAVITALATVGGQTVIAALLEDGSSRIYLYTYPSLRALCTHSEEITALAVIGGVPYAGDAAGIIYAITTELVPQFVSGEAVVSRLAENGGLVYAGLGNSGKVVSDVDAWEIAADLPWLQTRGLGTLNGWMWAGGYGTGGQCLWQEGNDGWAQALQLDQVTAVNDLLGVAADGRNQLFVATENGGTTSRLYRVEITPAGKLQMSGDFPSASFRIVRSH